MAPALLSHWVFTKVLRSILPEGRLVSQLGLQSCFLGLCISCCQEPSGLSHGHHRAECGRERRTLDDPAPGLSRGIKVPSLRLLVGSVERVALDLQVVGSSPTLDVEMT